MQRTGEDLLDRALLDLASGVHHHHALAHLGHHAEVVRDQHDRRAEPVLQVAHQVEDLRLDRHVQRRRRLVGDQQLRIARQRHRDHHPLAHAAGKLMRILAHPPLRRGNADQHQHLDRPLLGVARRQALVKLQRLADLPADRQHRVEAGHRLLEDHRDRVAADVAHLRLGDVEQVAALEADRAGDLAGRLLDQPQDRHRGDRLAAAGLADDARASRRHRRGTKPLDRAHHAVGRREMRLQVLDFQQRHLRSAWPAAGRARRAARRPAGSPTAR